eukprot:TRINITY_DN158_c0_g1_i1.p3 TRINITY_DN158_c0_g1~~TRINITY_DN158_c0_g1_i1.p3  ORF type:complete len:127 (-),score=1.84 TRINITY_DN158_c0_g1_i1:158-517(-)
MGNTPNYATQYGYGTVVPPMIPIGHHNNGQAYLLPHDAEALGWGQRRSGGPAARGAAPAPAYAPAYEAPYAPEYAPAYAPEYPPPYAPAYGPPGYDFAPPPVPAYEPPAYSYPLASGYY